MKYELDPALQTRAESFLATNSKLKGLPYLTSPIKRGLDLLSTGPSIVIYLPVIFLLGMVILASDRHWPFVELGC